MEDQFSSVLFFAETLVVNEDAEPDLFIIGPDGRYDRVSVTVDLPGQDVVPLDGDGFPLSFSAQTEESVFFIGPTLRPLVPGDQSRTVFEFDSDGFRELFYENGDPLLIGFTESVIRVDNPIFQAVEFAGRTIASVFFPDEGIELAEIGDDGVVRLLDLDPTEAGVQTTIPGFNSRTPINLTVAEDRLFFEATNGLDSGGEQNLAWIEADGSFGELDARPDLSGVQPFDIDIRFSFADQLVYIARLGDRQIAGFAIDGALEITSLPGLPGASPGNGFFEVFGEELVVDAASFGDFLRFDAEGIWSLLKIPFRGQIIRVGDSLVEIDNTKETLSIVDRIDATRTETVLGSSFGGERWGRIQEFASLGDRLYFIADSGDDNNFTEEGVELWVLDENSVVSQIDFDPGTPQVQTLTPGPTGSFPLNGANFVEVNDHLYFTATTREEGSELYVITPSGAVQLVDFNLATPGIQTFNPGGDGSLYRGLGPGGYTAVDGVGLFFQPQIGFSPLDNPEEFWWVDDGAARPLDLDPTTPEVDGLALPADPDQFRPPTISLNGFLPLAFDPVTGGSQPGLGQGLTQQEAREVALLYEAGLDRDGNIDLPGLNFWIDQREVGLSVLGLAAAFLNSDEFQASAEALLADGTDLTDTNVRNGSVFSNEDYVVLLYENVLDRMFDEPGRDFWLSVLETFETNPNQSATARERLLLAFAESDENRNGSPVVDTLTEASPGEWDFV